MCFYVFYHVQCVAESTTKDILSRNLGFITKSRFRCSALYNFGCILLTEFHFYFCSNVYNNICTNTNQTLACGSISQ